MLRKNHEGDNFPKIAKNCMKTKEFPKIVKNCTKTKEFLKIPRRGTRGGTGLRGEGPLPCPPPLAKTLRGGVLGQFFSFKICYSPSYGASGTFYGIEKSCSSSEHCFVKVGSFLPISRKCIGKYREILKYFLACFGLRKLKKRRFLKNRPKLF